MGVRRKLIGIVGALICAIAGTFLVLNARNAEEPALVREQVPVLVAGQALAAGTSVDKLATSEGLVRVAQVDVAERSTDALTGVADLSGYKGMVVASNVTAGQPLMVATFGARGSLQLGAGGIEIPPDRLQISFSLEPQRVLGGSLRAGDLVAVVYSNTATPTGDNATAANQTHIIMQKALVANVQLSNLANAGETPPEGTTSPALGNYTVTLALSAGDVERITNALEYGKIWLAKQPATADGANTKIWDLSQTIGEPVTSYSEPAQ